MPIRSDMNFTELLFKIVGHQTGEISKVTYSAQKPAFPQGPVDGESFLEEAQPEAEGVASEWLCELLERLEASEGAAMHKIMVMRHGKVIMKAAFEPYDLDEWHIAHSMCKSITGMAIGILESEDKIRLGDKVLDYFQKEAGLGSVMRQRDITIENLLTMTSGVKFNEIGAITGDDWIKGYLDSGLSSPPGKEFDYNSMNSYMLSAIVSRVTGMSLFDFVKERIFEPMGIRRVFWEADPKGITKGGWGLFMRIEDMCKLGQLYLNGGAWNDQQIVPRDWVTISSMEHARTDVPHAPSYGYQLWRIACREGAYNFNGMLGQNVYIFPDVDMIVATNASNPELFQRGDMADVIYDMMEKLQVDDSRSATCSSVSSRRLQNIIRRIEGSAGDMPLIRHGGWNRGMREYSPDLIAYEKIRNLSGSAYSLLEGGIGIFPLMIQMVHNNFTDGIGAISFAGKDRSDMVLEIHEGDQMYRLPILRNKSERVQICMHGEYYNVAVKSRLSTDEYGRVVLMLRLVYTEEATERRINIYLGSKYKDEDTSGLVARRVPTDIDIHFSEYPGNNLLTGSMKNVSAYKGSLQSKIIGILEGYGAGNVLSMTMHYTVSPRVHGVLITENTENTVSAEGLDLADTETAADIAHTDNDINTSDAANSEMDRAGLDG
ncbi:serine hydrolase domain-containing protein [Butyrivibrio sp. MC2013]|uniref:serine hydrolase domain-containing protein n=1 Tax=Butyrivibrio sp. MC2013 TaxID=1280686 RepID=UPI000421B476|nr:serine hydrolase [Butyrivibrio sp. MC2013]